MGTHRVLRKNGKPYSVSASAYEMITGGGKFENYDRCPVCGCANLLITKTSLECSACHISIIEEEVNEYDA